MSFSTRVECPKACGGLVPVDEAGKPAYTQCYRCYVGDSEKEMTGELRFTPVPTCIEVDCNERTRPYKNDPNRYTKRCDKCSGAHEMTKFANKAKAAVGYKGPVCRNGICTSEAALYRGHTDKYRKYCAPCGEERAIAWKSWVAFREEKQAVIDASKGAPKVLD